MEPFQSNRGFTLIELLVVLAIIVVITTITITSQSTFNKTLVLANATYDLGLSLRNAEIYGIGSRAVGAATSPGYGLEFTTASPASFILFADTIPAASCSTPACKPGDGVYGDTSERVQTYTLNNGIKITNFCGVSGGTTYCVSGGSVTITRLDVVFIRPNTAALITALSGGSVLAQNLSRACITLSAPAGTSRYVSVSSIGAISVSATSCP